MRNLRALVADSRAATTIFIAAFLPAMLAAGALAIDIGSIHLDQRRLQGMADAAALAAAIEPDEAQSRARAVVDAAGWDRSVAIRTTLGSYSGARPDPARRFRPDGGSDAVRVTLVTRSPTFLAQFFGPDTVVIERSATAARENMASFSIGSGLASLDAGMLNAYLSALTGSRISLSLVDYRALADADVDLFGFLGALRQTASVRAGTFNDALAAKVTPYDSLKAAATATQGGIARAAMMKLAQSASGRSAELSSLFDLGELGMRDSIGSDLHVRIGALPLASALILLGARNRQAAVDLDAGVPGIAATKLWLAIGERPRNSPWLAITDHGEPVVRTAQARVYLENRIGGVSLPGLGAPVSLDVPIFVEAASAAAKLDTLSCGAGGRNVTLRVQPGLGQAAIGTVDTSRLDDFGTPVTPDWAPMARLPLVRIDGKATVDLGSAEAWQSVRFSGSDIDGGTVRTVSSAAIAQSVADSLANRLEVRANAAGFLPVASGPIRLSIISEIVAVAPGIDRIVNLATGALGVRYGKADVRVTGLRCGQSALVG